MNSNQEYDTFRPLAETYKKKCTIRPVVVFRPNVFFRPKNTVLNLFDSASDRNV